MGDGKKTANVGNPVLDALAYRFLTRHKDLTPAEHYRWQREYFAKYSHCKRGLFGELRLPFWQSRIYAHCVNFGWFIRDLVLPPPME